MIYIPAYHLTQWINYNAQTLTDYGGGRGGDCKINLTLPVAEYYFKSVGVKHQ
jgi:hypothetical protein